MIVSQILGEDLDLLGVQEASAGITGNTTRQDPQFIDLVNAAYAEKIINGRYWTLNDFKSKPTTNSRYPLGAHLDYLLVKATKRPRVSVWKQVLNLTGTGKFSGTIPSDHNLVTMRLTLS